MSVSVIETSQIVASVNQAVLEHGADSEELIPILMDVNGSLGYLPTRAMVEISKSLKLPISRVYSVASFYKMLSTEPRGRHVIQFCESAPCHVVGGRQVSKALEDELGIVAGETTPDGKWTIIMTSCIGTCGVGPVMGIDDDLYGNLTGGLLAEILGKYD